MSVDALKWAEQQKLPPNHALLLRTLAWSINLHGNGWLSQKRMAARSNQISLSTVKRALCDLRRMGILNYRWAVEQGRKRKCYTLDLRKIVIWNRRECTWRQYVSRLAAQYSDSRERPGETRKQYVERQVARLSGKASP